MLAAAVSIFDCVALQYFLSETVWLDILQLIVKWIPSDFLSILCIVVHLT